VVKVGLTTTTEPVKVPGGFQVYETAPVAVNVALLPLQIDGELAASVMVGVGFTTMVNILELTQPKALVPLSV